MANKIRQSENVRGISICGNEVKLSQFADDTNLICSDLKSVENAVSIVVDFGSISGLSLNKEKTKAMWLGESANNRNAPLQSKWVNGPTRFLCVFFLSYDKKENDHQTFVIKMQKLQSNLDIWRSRDSTLFGRVFKIIKSLGISPLVYSASNVDVPDGLEDNVKRRLFQFVWKNKRDRIKRTG